MSTKKLPQSPQTYPTLRTYLTVPIGKLQSLVEETWQYSQQGPSNKPGLTQRQRLYLLGRTRPEQRDVTQALVYLLQDDDDITRELVTDTKVTGVYLTEVVTKDTENSRLLQNATSLHARANDGLTMVSAAMAGANQLVIETVDQLKAEDPKEAGRLESKYSEARRLHGRPVVRQKKLKGKKKRNAAHLQTTQKQVAAATARNQAQNDLIEAAKAVPGRSASRKPIKENP